MPRKALVIQIGIIVVGLLAAGTAVLLPGSTVLLTTFATTVAAAAALCQLRAAPNDESLQ